MEICEKEKLAKEIAKKYSLNLILLFGSRASGKSYKGSDFDVAYSAKKKLGLEKKAEVEDGIGDMFWFLSLLANSYDIDIDQAAQIVIDENERRFPLDQTKDKHTNINLGGYDGHH